MSSIKIPILAVFTWFPIFGKIQDGAKMATMFGDATGLSSATTDKIYLNFREDKRLLT